MASHKEVLDRRKEVTDKISTQVRTLAVSFIAIVWLFLVPGKDGSPVLPHEPDQSFLLYAGLAAVMAMVVDFLHYVFAYKVTQQVIKTAGSNGQPAEYSYNYDTHAYRAQLWCFWGKQVLVAAAFVLLTITFVKALLGL